MQDIQISAVIPAYQAERTLSRCVESIVTQAGCKWELIIVDDGSTDATLSIAKSYADKDSRIRVLHQENQGRSVARNNGVLHASGEWILFADADDYYAKDAFDTLLNGVREGVVGVYGGFVRGTINSFNIDCVVASRELGRALLDVDSRICGLEDESVYVKRGSALIAGPWGKLYRRNVIQGAIVFPEKVRTSEDAIFNLRFYASGGNISLIKEPVYCWTLSEDSTTQTYSSLEGSTMLNIADALSDLLDGSQLWGGSGTEHAFLGAHAMTILRLSAKSNESGSKLVEDLDLAFKDERVRRGIVSYARKHKIFSRHLPWAISCRLAVTDHLRAAIAVQRIIEKAKAVFH